ncbi:MULTISPECIES: hypothetical protein [unclassified Streptomyces]|uniref:hypothetical protein n=1 Tax=unclassified Streptomyces TaxID=2593676 RepID=UPI0019092E53|nr:MULTISPECIES: hypothetical protein [unclassified Streptomyces]MBK3568446.1 hypothetical protein [Streptomyces sp. MBT62]MBK6017678.1 hypothetical protein [Streptomyces sp. MBT53]
MAAVSGQVWLSLTSFGGVVLGGVLSFLVQFTTQRSAERAQQRHQRTELAEARRAERLALLERFVEVGAEAERVAFARPPEWDDTTPWKLTAQDVMNRLWVVERLVRIQFPLPVHEAARRYFLDLNQTVWWGLPDGESVRDYLEDNRLAFLDAARAVMQPTESS